MSTKLLHLATAGMLALAAAGAGHAIAGERAEILGDWGGDGVLLTLTESGGTLDWGCQTAEIDGPVAPNERGRFKATGRVFPAAFGPAIYPVPESRKPRPVKYRGLVEGKRLRLILVRSGSLWPREQRRTRIELVKGRAVRLHRCL